MRFKQRRNAVAQGEVHHADDADDAGAGAGRAVDPACAPGRRAGGELRLTERAALLGPRGAVHGAALHEHCRADVVPGAGVVQQVVPQVALARLVPEVVVRVHDRQRGFEDLLPNQVEPGLAHHDVARCGHQGVAHRGRHAPSASSVDPDVRHPRRPVEK
jgi:hypothetical protein